MMCSIMGKLTLRLVVPSPGLHRLRSGVERFQAIGARSHCVSDLSHASHLHFDLYGFILQFGSRSLSSPIP